MLPMLLDMEYWSYWSPLALIDWSRRVPLVTQHLRLGGDTEGVHALAMFDESAGRLEHKEMNQLSQLQLVVK